MILALKFSDVAYLRKCLQSPFYIIFQYLGNIFCFMHFGSLGLNKANTSAIREVGDNCVLHFMK